ncbi:MAG: zf-HC2 domain-containing protein, partial [Longimicrobiales bacterium]
MQHVDDALLVAYADDALTPSERGAVEAHLVSCAECRARVDEERALAQRAAAVLGVGAPDEAAVPSFEDVLRRTERTDATSAGTIDADRTRRRSLKPLALAATLIIALGAGWIARVLFRSPEFNAPAQRTEAASDDAAESAVTRGEPALAPSASEQPAGGAADQA